MEIERPCSCGGCYVASPEILDRLYDRGGRGLCAKCDSPFYVKVESHILWLWGGLGALLAFWGIIIWLLIEAFSHI